MTEFISQLQKRPGHERRVLMEFIDLQEKAQALRAFLGSRAIDELEPADQNLLYEQYRIMGMYLGVLENRIQRFVS